MLQRQVPPSLLILVFSSLLLHLVGIKTDPLWTCVEAHSQRQQKVNFVEKDLLPQHILGVFASRRLVPL